MNGPFFTILYLIYTYFLLLLVSNLFDGAGNYLIIPLTLAIAGIYLLATVTQGLYPNPITHFFFFLSEIWKGTSIYLFIFTIAMHIISWIVQIPNTVFIIVLFILVPLISVYAVYNANKIKINNINLSFDNLFEDLKFIHISDLHIGAIRGDRLLNNIVNKINSNDLKDADFVVITGDLADGSSPIDLNSFKALANSKVPIFFTLGNHDFYPGIDDVIGAVESANITVLSNQFVEIKGTQLLGIPFGREGLINRPAKNIDSDSSNDLHHLINNGKNNEKNNGKNNEWDIENNKDMNFKINIDFNKFLILLHHVPVGWELFKEIGVDLVLSGHTHGGQFLPFNFLVKRVFPYIKGLYEDNGKYLFVSEGIGTLSPPMRLATTAEMAVFHLKKTNND
jgi:predicted MPP superfamily phosphohydrolase